MKICFALRYNVYSLCISIAPSGNFYSQLKFTEMKNSIKTMIDSLVHDNASFIKENGGNVAEWILLNDEAEDQGYLWYLTDEEITDFENGNSEKYINEIRNYVNENYNYKLE